jgi:hypothetical protein
MKTGHTGLSPGVACLAALVVGGSAVVMAAGPARDVAHPGACPAVAAAPQEPSPRADCCFTNRSFSGVCRVRPAESETCATILAYLNDPRSQGRSYCGATTIRTGWQQVPCEAPPGSGPVETVDR